MPHGGYKQSGYGKDLSRVLARGLHADQARDGEDRLSVETAQQLVKPKLRGVFHELGYAAVAVGVVVIVTADPGRARMAGVIFASCVRLLLRRKRRLPSTDGGGRGALARPARPRRHLLADRRQLCAVRPDRALGGWAVGAASSRGGALAAIILKLCWVQAPKWLVRRNRSDARLDRSRHLPAVADALDGGHPARRRQRVLYTVGAVVYTRRRPDPRPQVFGYHELFHVLTVAAVACEYVVVASLRAPSGVIDVELSGKDVAD